MGGVGSLFCSPQVPGGVKVLGEWQIATNNLLSEANDMLKSAFVLGSGSSIPDGKDGLDGGCVEVLSSSFGG